MTVVSGVQSDKAVQVAQMYLEVACLSIMLVSFGRLAWLSSPVAEACEAQRRSQAAEKERLLKSQARPCPLSMLPASATCCPVSQSQAWYYTCEEGYCTTLSCMASGPG